ncbi:MAG: Do family serine endopeptidase [Alphaproteobacteria bacterium]|nr:Do family serine endopeptidase [Alphaproteobacteria bacterium SS10]
MRSPLHIRPFAVAVALVLALAIQAPPSLAPMAEARGTPDSFADLAERLLPSVVNISTTQSVGGGDGPSMPDIPNLPPGTPFEEFFRDFFERQQGNRGNRNRQATSLGSGFVIDAKNGYVVTNNHVIADAEEISVIFADDTRLEAELVGRDPKTDLAVLRVDPDEHELVEVPFGDSDVMRVGDWVLAIGNPFGLGGTVTAGIISARARDINAGPYDDFLQTDASINRGNSGGPMFNIDGGVIGINTAIFSPSGGSVGIGFAIPANLARPVIDQLIEFGRTKRGWLGVRIQQVTDDIAESLGLDEARGALVAQVTPDGPAEDAKIEQGDIILTFDGKEVEDMRRLPRIVAETRIGETVPVVVWRNGERQRLNVELGELEAAEEAGLLDVSTGDAGNGDPAVPDDADALEGLGLSLSAISPRLRDRFELSEELDGVVITAIDDNGPAAEKDLQTGDVIVEVNQQSVSTPEDVADMVREARNKGRGKVLMLVDREGQLRFIAVDIDQG